MTLTDGRCQWPFQGHVVLLDRCDCIVWNSSITIFNYWSDIASLPLNWYVRGCINVLDRLRYFWADSVTFYQGDSIFTVRTLLALKVRNLVLYGCSISSNLFFGQLLPLFDRPQATYTLRCRYPSRLLVSFSKALPCWRSEESS